MDLDDIQRIVELMQENDITDFKLEREGMRISLKRNNGTVVASTPSHTVVMPAATTAAPLQVQPAAQPAEADS